MISVARSDPAPLVGRYFRILFSTLIAAMVALVISGLLWGNPNAHFAHRIGGFWIIPLVISPIFIGVAFILLLLDQTVFRWIVGLKGGSAGLTLILTSLTGLGYFDPVLGTFFAFLLVYWLMTGRVAGRPGWSLNGFVQIAWDEKFYLLFSGFVCAAFLYAFLPVLPQIVFPSNAAGAKTRAHLENPDHWYGKQALSRFPDAVSCLDPEAANSRPTDFQRLDWTQIRHQGDAELCVFRLLAASGGVAQATAWFEAQGFTTGTPWTSDNPYVTDAGHQRVYASWAAWRDGPKYPADPLRRIILHGHVVTIAIEAEYDPTGQTMTDIRISHTIK